MKEALRRAMELLRTAVINFVKALKRLTVSIEKSLLEVFKTIRAINITRFDIQSANFDITRIAAMVLALLIITVTSAYGQDLSIDISTPQKLFEHIDPLYSGLVILGGYASAFIPGLNKINDGTIRVLAFAIVTAAGFIMFKDNVTVGTLAVSYAVSTSLYEVVLKWFRKSDKPEDGTTFAIVKVPAETTTDTAANVEG